MKDEATERVAQLEMLDKSRVPLKLTDGQKKVEVQETISDDTKLGD